MKLLALGVDHRTAPAPIREALAFDGPKLDRGLAELAATFPGSEFVVLSTCNRVEVYAAGAPGDVPGPEALAGFLRECDLCVGAFLDVPLAMGEIQSILRRSHRLRLDQPDDFAFETNRTS